MFEIKTSGPAERRSLYYSLILSILILAGCLAWAFNVGLKANKVDHALGHATDYLNDLRSAHGAKKGPAK